jgi:hypothetical protein
MVQKSIKNEKLTIDPKAWYVLTLHHKKPKVFWRAFKTKEKCLEYIRINGKIKSFLFLPIKGESVISYDLKLSKWTRRFKGLWATYKYPADRITRQDRKSFRTKYRRWMRDYGKGVTSFTDFKRYGLSNREISNNSDKLSTKK